MRVSRKSFLICFLITLFTFQSGLESIWDGFSYIDESVIIIVFILVLKESRYVSKMVVSKNFRKVLLIISVYFLSGIIPYFIYHYQNLNVVIQDLIANSKFLFSICSGYLIIQKNILRKYENEIKWVAIQLSYIIFIVFLVDRFFNIYGGVKRYGIKSAMLFYHHSTYLAGAMALLLVCIAMTYSKRSRLPMILDLIVLCMTLRSKAIVAAIVFVFLFWLIVLRKKKLKKWQIVLMAVVSILLAWSQIEFYYIVLSGHSARSVLLLTSLIIMRDYFPLGTGFGTFASHSAAINYSPVYIKYGFNSIWEVSSSNPNAFLDDTFWPIIFGQTGAIGTIAYVTVICFIAHKIQYINELDRRKYLAAVFALVYLMISSIAEPAFNNSVSVPLGFILGLLFRNFDNSQASSLIKCHK